MEPRRPPGTAAAAVPVGVVVHALVPAAGRGERFGGERLKQTLEVAGQRVVSWTVERLLAVGCASVVVALPEELLGEATRWFPPDAGVRTVAGGSTRQASVAAALAASPAAVDEWVAVHDGARAALSSRDFVATVEAALGADGAILGRQVTDTIKRLEGGWLASTVNRDVLFRAETPQVFRRGTLEAAFEAARRDCFLGTDEASLVERLPGVRIAAVRAAQPNPKLTRPEDLAELERLLMEGTR